VVEEWILDDSSRSWSADAGRWEFDDLFPCPWSTGVEEEWILEDSSKSWSADDCWLEEYDDNSCPCSTGVEEELDAMIGPCVLMSLSSFTAWLFIHGR
jgi:hypothetical protein